MRRKIRLRPKLLMRNGLDGRQGAVSVYPHRLVPSPHPTRGLISTRLQEHTWASRRTHERTHEHTHERSPPSAPVRPPPAHAQRRRRARFAGQFVLHSGTATLTSRRPTAAADTEATAAAAADSEARTLLLPPVLQIETGRALAEEVRARPAATRMSPAGGDSQATRIFRPGIGLALSCRVRPGRPGARARARGPGRARP